MEPAIKEPPDGQLEALARVRAMVRASGFGLFLGETPAGPAFSPPEHGVLVLGPPRSGKTTSIVVPNVIAAPHAVLSTSTKADVLVATARARRLVGRCLLFDPGGGKPAAPGVEEVGWSPLRLAASFEEAVLVAHAMAAAARPGTDRGESAHWTERAGILVACLLHAAALEDAPITAVLSAVYRHEPTRALDALDRLGAHDAFDHLSGIIATDPREQSGIWSTASGVLSAYQSPAAVTSALLPPLDPAALLDGGGTLYIVAPSDTQRQAAALVAGLVHDVRRAAYAVHRQGGDTHATGRAAPRLLLVLDEVANIAPLQDLPQLAAEGASQGVLTLACLQDLAQARARWGQIADGFFSLFGTKVVLAGIADTRTLQAISMLAGDHDVLSPTTSRQRAGLLAGRGSRSVSLSWRREPRLAPSAVGRGAPGEALVLVGTDPARVRLAPYHASPLWRRAAGAPLAPGVTPRVAPGTAPGVSPGR